MLSRLNISFPQPLRLPTIIVTAIGINLALFILIHSMVTSEQFRPPEIENINLVDFIRFKEPPKSPDEQIEEEIVDEPPPPETPPPPPEMSKPEPVKPEPVEMDLPTPQLDVPLSLSGQPYLGDFMKSVKPAPIKKSAAPPKPAIATNLIPTVKIPPTYPSRALRLNIEGVVTVEFTIGTDGSVSDPEIIKAKPPKIFDRAVLKAITKWKFNPKMQDGKPVAIRARQDVNFTLKN